MEKVNSQDVENGKRSSKGKVSKSSLIKSVNDEGSESGNNWDCTVCTFKNTGEAFKCLMCNVRKGTNTRKPRINPELVAQQVARQEQHLLHKSNLNNHHNNHSKIIKPPLSNPDCDCSHPFRFDFDDSIESSKIIRTKLIRRKKAKSKKKYLTVKANEDYFDESIMELINFRLAEISMITGLDFFDNQSDLLFISKVIGKCCPDKEGISKVLIRWEPEGIIPDEWVSEGDLTEMSSRRVPLKSLPIDSLTKILEKSDDKSSRGRKHRRE